MKHTTYWGLWGGDIIGATAPGFFSFFSLGFFCLLIGFCFLFFCACIFLCLVFGVVCARVRLLAPIVFETSGAVNKKLSSSQNSVSIVAGSSRCAQLAVAQQILNKSHTSS